MCSNANFSLRPLRVMILAVIMEDSPQHSIIAQTSVHSHRQLQASRYTFRIWSPPSANVPSNISVAIFPTLPLHKRGIFLQDVTPTGQSSPCHKGRGCCNRRMPWFTSKCSPSWDRISLHPLFLSPAIIRVERLSCSHVKITELRWMVWYG